ncbi:Polyribonucleotide nucleotidyltransferase [Geodia barretti]|uniref:Polyribonucleotide nucleotidyltransferase n=1 Tax=Geodia barretti TaxID=519541 RepID=A0AA35R341_GEOBA|nr:Polyribonucleotide nucleotidyltransferase [Geodia barretti]
MPEATVVERIIGNEKLVIESGKLAFQAHGSAVLTYGETVVLATAVMADKPRGDIDFLPLTVEFEERLYSAVRRRILDLGVRPDGRNLSEIRPITCEVGTLPRTHGSGLFTRGQTQVLSVATLGPLNMKQTLDSLSPVNTKHFMHHYNFPPYSVGEARRVGSPGRREIGHGALAERAILSALPAEGEFPYTIRVVSEVLSSNGSTSMGSVCGTSMALMDAGVPMKAPVAGIAMGLVTDNDGRHAVLSDIQGIEDFLGDMDFKVAGTAAGINALQMDIKLKGLDEDILRQALEQARLGRLHILDKMSEAITETRTEMSPYAPKSIRVQIPVEKIGAVIGPGGRVIRGIIEETGASIDVADDDRGGDRPRSGGGGGFGNRGGGPGGNRGGGGPGSSRGGPGGGGQGGGGNRGGGGGGPRGGQGGGGNRSGGSSVPDRRFLGSSGGRRGT